MCSGFAWIGSNSKEWLKIEDLLEFTPLKWQAREFSKVLPLFFFFFRKIFFLFKELSLKISLVVGVFHLLPNDDIPLLEDEDLLAYALSLFERPINRV